MIRLEYIPLLPRDINEELIGGYQDIDDIREVDLVFRTSGENRLSEFLLFQSGYSFIKFEQKLFPDFGFWDIIKVFMRYPASSRIMQVCSKPWLSIAHERRYNFATILPK